MSEELTVKRIMDDNAKSGVSSKTNKPWSMSRVELSNGEGVFIFNPIAEGDKVVGVQNGDYMNYQKVKPDPKHDEIMEALRKIYKAITGEESQDKPAPKKDVVAPMPEDDEEIPLDQIPF